MSVASLYEGTIDWLVHDLGVTLGDYTITRAADGDIGRDKAATEINTAQTTVQRYLLAHGVRKAMLARRVSLTQDSSDTAVWYLPVRMNELLAVTNTGNQRYTPIYSRLRGHEPGYILERTLVADQAGWRKVIRFWNVDPGDTVYAWVLEEPAKLSGGDATFAATSITLSATPGLGMTVLTDDYYIGTQVQIVLVGAAAEGAIRTVTDSVSKTRVCTVATWATTPTAQDDYSFLCQLPRECWRLVVLEAARRILRVDKSFEDSREDVLSELAEVRTEVVLNLRKGAEGMDAGPREADEWIT